jgi:hypothetical protein
MRIRLVLAASCVVSLALGCGGGEAGKEAASRVAALEDRLAKLELGQRNADNQATMLALQVASLQLANIKNDAAWFDPQQQQAYLPISTPVGPVLFLLEKVEPYLDGFRITFRVGNPSAANLNGFEAEVEWGPKPEETSMPSPPTKTITAKFTETIHAGSWNLVRVNVAPAKATDIRRIGITPVFNRLQLRN